MNWQQIAAPFFWVLNGLLVVLYVLVERWQTVLLVPALVWLFLRGPKEHRTWAFRSSVFALATSLICPQPVPILLLVLAVAYGIAITAEKFNPTEIHWRSVSALASYSLVGLGMTTFTFYIQNQSITNPMFSQGQTYIGIIAGVALYGVPLGYLSLLAQRLLVHPPLPGSGSPSELINALRARRQD